MSLLKKIIPTGSWTPDEVRKTLGDLIRMSRDKEELLFQLFSLLRSAVSAIGEDFKRASMISSSSDVHFLHIDEIIEATSSTFDDMHKLVEERKSNYKIWCDYYTPDVFSGTRLNLNPVNFEPNLGLKSTQGIPVYPGKVRGRALRVSKIEDFRRVEPDSILVVERLSPILAPFFLNASGIIIEENGPFPNDIILVRRMKKPAVSGFPGLRRMIKDGDALEIDGEQGTIQLFG
jgi:pyruvate,water dikinase